MYDAIVVGAGLSGLVCARRLVEAGADVLVLEARDRVGGRLHSGRVGGALVDLGGQWVTPGQARVVALAAELDVALAKHDRGGAALVDHHGGVLAAFAQWRAMRRIERMMRDPDRRDDARTVADLLAEIRNRVARERIALHADLVFATDPASLSLLFYLNAMAATGGFRPSGTDEFRLAGGAQLLAERLAERLGERVHLGEAASEIVQTEREAAVRGVQSYRTRRVVLAMPPPLVRNIAIDLPPRMRAYADGAFAGPVVKCFAAYERAFWRDHGYSGESYQMRGAVRATVELAGTPPVLCAFVVGREAGRWRERAGDDRRAEVLAAFARFGDVEPLDYLEVDWGSDPWSAGCVPGVPPSLLGGGARWREPHARIHIAGTESATQWPGYMEGAIDAGERAAAELLAAL